VGSVLHELSEAVAGWDPSRSADRAACAEALAAMERNMEAAIAIWRECADSTDAVENRYTALIALGAERAKALHRLHLEQKAAAAKATQASGVALTDALGIAEDLDVVQAYGQFAADESIASRAERAITTLEARREAVSKAIGQL
jgi:hypothetical protein